MLKYHFKWLILMLERCRQIQLSLNIKMHIFNPYRNYTGTYCMQRRHQSRFRKIKNHSRLETSSQSKTSQSLIRSSRLLQEIHSSLFRHDIPFGRIIKGISEVRMDWRMWCILWHFKEKISRSTYSQVSKLVSQISHTHQRIRHSNRHNINTAQRWWEGLPNCV